MPDVEELKARGGFCVPKLKAGTRILIESNVGTLFDLRVVSPLASLITVYSTDPIFQPHPPKNGIFVESWVSKTGELAIPDWIVRDTRMVIRFSDANFLSEPVVSARLEGSGWHYEAISPERAVAKSLNP